MPAQFMQQAYIRKIIISDFKTFKENSLHIQHHFIFDQFKSNSIWRQL